MLEPLHPLLSLPQLKRGDAVAPMPLFSTGRERAMGSPLQLIPSEGLVRCALASRDSQLPVILLQGKGTLLAASLSSGVAGVGAEQQLLCSRIHAPLRSR